jgi:tRNA dimethylallyltransferase
MSQVPLVVVVGPTAAGKSDLAVEIAAALDAEVISADSVQVYRGFDIGTGKLSTAEMQGVPHHLMDVVDPDEPFSAAHFVELADEAAAGIAARGRRVVVAGGTGLYVRALVRGLFQAPPASEEIRRRHREEAADLGVPALHRRLAAEDPEAADRIHENDLVRISRALEVLEQTGRTISDLQREHRELPPRYPAALMLGLAPDRPTLRDRIERRVHAMMEAGWLEETRALMARGYGEARPMGSLGYRQLSAHLRGELDLAEAVRQTVRDTRRFARRQLTWFKEEPGISWIQRPDQLDMELARSWAENPEQA